MPAALKEKAKAKPKSAKGAKKGGKGAPPVEASDGGGPRGFAICAWLLILLACGLALVPTLEFAAWLIAVPMLVAALVLAIFVLNRGGRRHGIVLMVFAMAVAPAAVAFAPQIAEAAGLRPAAEAKGRAAQNGAVKQPKPKAATVKVRRAANAAPQPTGGKAQPVRQHAILD